MSLETWTPADGVPWKRARWSPRKWLEVPWWIWIMERRVGGAFWEARKLASCQVQLGAPSRAQGTVLAASYWLRLRMCFLGGSQARLLPSTTRRSQFPYPSRRVQLGAPSRRSQPRPGHRAHYPLSIHNHQPPSTINHQPSTINHQPSTINHQPSTTINH